MQQALAPDGDEWTPIQNNWEECLQSMQEGFNLASESCSGAEFSIQKVLGATRGDRLQEALGRGPTLRVQTQQVKEVYCDSSFAPEIAWNRDPEVENLPQPAYPWARLRDFFMDSPCPEGDYFSNHHARPGRVYQGSVDNFYFCQALQTLGMKPQLVRNVFADMAFSNPEKGFFILRFHRDGRWQPVLVDDSMPVDAQGSPLWAASEYPDFAYSWPGLIEKAYAKLHGSWEALGEGGRVEEVLQDLSGGCASRFSSTDVAPDRLWQYLYEMTPLCVFGCSLNAGECSRRHIPLDAHFACSIYDVQRVNGIPYVSVCCAAPAFMLRCMPVCNVTGLEGHDRGQGFVWLRIDDFVQLFDVIYECRLVNPGGQRGHPNMMGVPHPMPFGHPHPGYLGNRAMALPGDPQPQPFGMHPGGPWQPHGMPGMGYPGAQPLPAGAHLENRWGVNGISPAEGVGRPFHEKALESPGAVYGETAPNFLITVHEAPCQIVFGASQGERRKNHARGTHAPLLLRFFQCSGDVDLHHGGELNVVHMSAWGYTRDAMCAVKVMKPGKFVCSVSMMMRYKCESMSFRCYSAPFPVDVAQLDNALRFHSVAPQSPLDALPYSLVGMPCVHKDGERLPQMFDESEGQGRPHGLALIADFRRELRRKAEKIWLQHDLDRKDSMVSRSANLAEMAARGSLKVVDSMHFAGGGHGHSGMHVTGHFGGRNAQATTNAAEAQSGDCVVS